MTVFESRHPSTQTLSTRFGNRGADGEAEVEAEVEAEAEVDVEVEVEDEVEADKAGEEEAAVAKLGTSRNSSAEATSAQPRA